MAIRQFVKEGVKGKFVCLPVLGRAGNLSPVLHLPPATAGTERLYCTSDGHFSVTQGWVLKQQSKSSWFFPSQQRVCITRPWNCCAGTVLVGGGELMLGMHLCCWPWRGLEADSGATGDQSKTLQLHFCICCAAFVIFCALGLGLEALSRFKRCVAVVNLAELGKQLTLMILKIVSNLSNSLVL